MPKLQKIPDDITADEVKDLVLRECEHCSKHNMLKVREVTYNERSEKSCILIYCPKCRAQDGVVEMEFYPVAPVESVEVDYIISSDYGALRRGRGCQ